MYNCQAAARDLNPSFHSSLKQAKEEMQKSRGVIDSELQRQHQLMRFRSAPSALLAEFVEEECKDFLPRSSSPETDAMIERFMSNSTSADLHDVPEKPLVDQRSTLFMEAELPQQNGYKHSGPQMMYPPPPPLPSRSSGIDSSFQALNSMAMDREQVKSGGNNSNLIRHSSSPAGLFSNILDGYGVMRSVANYRCGNGSSTESASPTCRLKNQINFSSRQTSSPALLSQISEMGEESLGTNPEDNSGRGYIPSFPMSSWDDTPHVPASFSGLKRARDHDAKMISNIGQCDDQNGEGGNHPSSLSHQFSLPKTSSEMAAVEKFLQLHDSVPCRIRAKRGCATHPRSIAERVRRTKISERMRKLQELVPNMDKQTNTADMLDLAVDYIKDLQKQVKMLSENRASCTCSLKANPYPTTG